LSDGNRITIEDLTKKLANKKILFERVNFSYNNLTDNAIKPLTDLMLTIQKNSEICMINLSFNRFTSIIWSDLKPVLGNQYLQFLDITGNPLSSIDSKDFFFDLINSGSKKLLYKIIFVYEHWLEGKNWVNCLVKDSKVLTALEAEIIANVEYSHKNYYMKYPSTRFKPMY